ncbi:MAG TPA: response regulator [Firmicutes bacterium]|nr:response regulator [Bacillota bacterium]
MKKMKKWKELLHKIRIHIIMFLALLVVAGISYQLLRTELLTNSQNLGTALAHNYASEENRNLTIYEAMLTFGTDAIHTRLENQEPQQEIEQWAQTYFKRVQSILGEGMVDPYAVVNGEIIAANPWEDPSYDIFQTIWYQQAIQADGEIIFTDIYIDAIDHMPVVTIAQKCKGMDAVIAFDISLENLQFQVNTLELPESISFFLCDGNGTVIYRQMESAYPDQKIQDYLDKILLGIRRGDFDRYDANVIDIDGQRRGVYYSMMPNGWIAIITIPYSMILEDLEQITIGFLLLFLVLLLFLILMTWRDLKINHQIERTNETIRVLGNSYYALYRVDFGKGTYEMIKGSDYVRSKIPPCGEYQELLRVAGEVIEADAYAEYIQSFSLSNIRNLVVHRIRGFGGDFLRKFGDTYRWVNVRILFDESLAPDEVVLCFQDVEEEKQQQLQERKLLEHSLEVSRQSEKSKQAFFSNMSHDMRTPLNAIVGLSKLAAESVGDPDKTASYIEKIRLAGQNLTELINDILDMSRMEQGKVILNHQQFDLKECIQECIETFQFQAETEQKKFVWDFDMQASEVMGDSLRIRQIMNNLLSNAFKFTASGDTVSVSVTQIGNQADAKYKIVVEDTGIGMSKEFLSHLFEPYARETRFGTKQVAGTGLGMAIVKNLIDQMNGHIYVESEQGEGSTFTVILPFIVAEAQEHQKREENQADPKQFSLEGRHVLLAEDNMINMEVATEVLEMNGVHVTKAWNGREAVEIFKASQPFDFDAILMDMQMPEMNGCEAAKIIRHLARPDAASIPIIAVTANAFAEDIAATTEAGMNAHVSKPIDFNILCRQLEKVIDSDK